MPFLQLNHLSTKSFKCNIQCILNLILLGHNKSEKIIKRVGNFAGTCRLVKNYLARTQKIIHFTGNTFF